MIEYPIYSYKNKKEVIFTAKLKNHKEEDTDFVKKRSAVLFAAKNKIKLSEANLRGANLHSMDLIEIDLSGADLTKADLSKTNLTSANLKDAILENTRFCNSHLRFANFRGIRGMYSNFAECDIMHAKFFEADLRSANFNNCRSFNTDFESAIMFGSWLKHSNFENANFENANLSDSDLGNCYLKNASFDGANLQNICWNNSDLSLAASFDNSYHLASFGPIGDNARKGYININEKGKIQIKLGCSFSSQEKTIERIRKKYGEKSYYENVIIAMCESVRKLLKKDKSND